MGFKDVIQNDLEQTFFNEEEFADKHTWGDRVKRTITAIVDDDVLVEKYSSEFDLLPKGSHLVYASASQFLSKPKIGSVIFFDGATYTLDEMHEEMGMYALFLSRSTTR